MQRIPEPLKILVEQLARLPGLGPKSAMRIAVSLLKKTESEVRKLGQSISDLPAALKLCSRCGGLSDQNPCHICANPERGKDILCLLPEWDSLLTMEEGNFYKGSYFILGGLLAPLDNRPAEALEIDRLIQRLSEGEVTELVLALGATAEAEATADFVRQIISGRFPAVKITRLAQGIPLGGEVKFMDRETLRQALRYRQEI